MRHYPHSKNHLLAAIIFLGFAGLTFDNLWLNFTTALPNNGHSTDYAIFYWDFWWMKKALVDLQVNPFTTNYVLYPYGGDLALHTFVPFLGLVSIPLQAIFSLITIFNLFVIGSIWLTAYLTYIFLHRHNVQTALAILGGIMVAFTPALQARAMEGHLNMLPMFWIPCLLVLFDLLVDRMHWGIAICLAIVTYAALMTDLQYLMWITTVLVPYGLYRLSRLARPEQKKLIQLIGVALLLFTPLIYLHPIKPILALNLIDFPQATIDTANAYSYPLTALFSRANLYFSFGHLLILLTIASGVMGDVRENRRVWLLIGLGNLVAAFGPYLELANQTRIPLPYALLHRTLDGFYRVPGRFAILAGFAFAVFVCLTAQNQIRQRAVKPVTVNLIVLLIGLGLIFDFGLLDSFQILTLPEYELYTMIKEDAQAQTILEVPFGIDVGYARHGIGHELIYYQPAHEKHILNGALSRAPYQTIQNYRSVSFLEAIAGNADLTPEADGQLSRLIDEWQIGYVTIHLEKLRPEMRDALLPFFASHPSLCYWRLERDLLAYQSRSAARCPAETSADIRFGTRADFPYVGTGWFPAEDIGGVQGRWASNSVLHIELAPQTYTLQFRALAFPLDQSVTIYLNETLVAKVPLENSWQTYEVTLPTDLFNNQASTQITIAHDLLQSAFEATNGESPDQRPLGAAYEWLTIAPIEQ